MENNNTNLRCAINLIDKKMVPINTFTDNRDKLLPEPFLQISKRKGFMNTITDKEIYIILTSDIIAMISDISNIITINIMTLMKNNNIPIVHSDVLYNDLIEIISESYVFNNPEEIISLIKSTDFNAYHRYIYTYIPTLLGDIYCRLQRENGISNMYNISVYSNNTLLIMDKILSKINILIVYYFNNILIFLTRKIGYNKTLDYDQVLYYDKVL